MNGHLHWLKQTGRRCGRTDVKSVPHHRSWMPRGGGLKPAGSRTPTYASEDEHLFKYSPGSLRTFLEPLVRALAMNCPLAVGKRFPEESGRVALKVERKAEDVEKAIKAQRKQLKEAEKQVGALADKVKNTQSAWAKEQEKFNGVRDKLMERRCRCGAQSAERLKRRKMTAKPRNWRNRPTTSPSTADQNPKKR